MMDTDIATALTVTVISSLGGLIPIFLGLMAAKMGYEWKKAFTTLAPAVSLGIIISLIYDLLQETAGLRIGELGTISQALTIILFITGLVVLQFAPIKMMSRKEVMVGVLVYGWAVGIGLHGFGEGIVVGYGFISGQEAFANVNQILSFGLHKVGEGFTIGTLLAIWRMKSKIWDYSGLLAGLPVGVGGAFGFLIDSAELSTYAFALGAGVTVYFMIQFSRLCSKETRAVYLATAAGFLFMYVAGLLHQF